MAIVPGDNSRYQKLKDDNKIDQVSAVTIPTGGSATEEQKHQVSLGGTASGDLVYQQQAYLIDRLVNFGSTSLGIGIASQGPSSPNSSGNFAVKVIGDDIYGYSEGFSQGTNTTSLYDTGANVTTNGGSSSSIPTGYVEQPDGTAPTNRITKLWRADSDSKLIPYNSGSVDYYWGTDIGATSIGSLVTNSPNSTRGANLSWTGSNGQTFTITQLVGFKNVFTGPTLANGNYFPSGDPWGGTDGDLADDNVTNNILVTIKRDSTTAYGSMEHSLEDDLWNIQIFSGTSTAGGDYGVPNEPHPMHPRLGLYTHDNQSSTVKVIKSVDIHEITYRFYDISDYVMSFFLSTGSKRIRLVGKNDIDTYHDGISEEFGGNTQQHVSLGSYRKGATSGKVPDVSSTFGFDQYETDIPNTSQQVSFSDFYGEGVVPHAVIGVPADYGFSGHTLVGAGVLGWDRTDISPVTALSAFGSLSRRNVSIGGHVHRIICAGIISSSGGIGFRLHIEPASGNSSDFITASEFKSIAWTFLGNGDFRNDFDVDADEWTITNVTTPAVTNEISPRQELTYVASWGTTDATDVQKWSTDNYTHASFSTTLRPFSVAFKNN